MVEGSISYLKPNEKSKQDLSVQYCRKKFILNELLNEIVATAYEVYFKTKQALYHCKIRVLN
jgi:hypothetical protein